MKLIYYLHPVGVGSAPSSVMSQSKLRLQFFSIQADWRCVTGKTAALGHYQDGHQIKWLWFYSLDSQSVKWLHNIICFHMLFNNGFSHYLHNQIHLGVSILMRAWISHNTPLMGHLRPCSPFHPSHDTGVHNSWARKIAVACKAMTNRAETFKGGNATVKAKSSSVCVCERVTLHGKWISTVEWKTLFQRWSWCKRFEHWPITDRSADGCRCVYLHV